MASAEHDTTSTQTTRLPGLEPPGPRRAWPFVVAAVAAAAVIALVALVALRDDSDQVRSEAVKRQPVATTAVTEPAPATTATTAQGGPPSATTQPPAGPSTTQAPKVAWEDVRLSLDGLGPVDIGMTPAEASTAAGFPIRVAPETDLGRGCAYAKADRGPSDRMFMVVDGRIVRIDIGGRGEARQTLTVSGIGVGSTEDEVKRTYPGRITVQGHPYVPTGHYLIYTPADPGLQHLRMVFETDGRVVTTFRAGLEGPASWIEGCS